MGSTTQENVTSAAVDDCEDVDNSWVANQVMIQSLTEMTDGLSKLSKIELLLRSVKSRNPSLQIALNELDSAFHTLGDAMKKIADEALS